MKMALKTLALAGSLAAASTQIFAQTAPAAPAEPAPDYTLVPKISLYTEYEYRGISQSSEKPALQFNLDYTHSSGFYLGTFVSNISWLKDYKTIGAMKDSAVVEIDFFGGYKYEFVKDWTLDVGVLHYDYPGSRNFGGLPKPNTNEIYAGVTYDAFNVKYSYSVGDTFGVAKSRGSSFIEFNYSKEILPKFTVNAQVAKQIYKGTYQGFNNDSELTYTVYKLGGAYDLGEGITIGGYYKDTNAKKANYTVLGKEWSKGRMEAFISKSF